MHELLVPTHRSYEQPKLVGHSVNNNDAPEQEFSQQLVNHLFLYLPNPSPPPPPASTAYYICNISLLYKYPDPFGVISRYRDKDVLGEFHIVHSRLV